MKKHFTLFILICCTTIAIGQTVQIGTTTYPTIDSAINSASAGDTILVTGLHTERVFIDKSIILKGNNPATDIIQAHPLPDSASGRTLTINNIGNNDVLVENLTIRHGNALQNGGGIFIDKVTGLVTLNNLVIENNATEKHGGGISILGSNANLNNVTIQNNKGTTSISDAGGLHMVCANGSGIDPVINIRNSLIAHNNTIRNSGGFMINGNNSFGDQYIITVNFENTTVAFNHADGKGGTGQVWGVDLVAGTAHTVGETNVHLNLKHVTFARNTSNATDNFGLYFTNGAANSGPVLNIYNSIIVSAGLLGNRAINFTQPATTDVINCYLGGTLGAGNILNEVNTERGKTAGQAGIQTYLVHAGGMTKALAVPNGSNTVDFCTAPTGVTMPTMDNRGQMRDASPDAGAFEQIAQAPPYVNIPISDYTFDASFVDTTLILPSDMFIDPNGDSLSISVSSSNTGVATVTLNGADLQITKAGEGASTISVSANDGFGGTANDDFEVVIGTVSTNDIQSIQGLKIFPNPVSNHQLTIQFDGIIENGLVSIYSTTGQILHQENFNNENQLEISLEKLSTGLYFIRIEDIEDSKASTVKIIKEK